MTAQLPLFDPHTRSRRGDPDTSHDAAQSLTSSHVRQSQLAILRLLRACGPMTDTELVRRYQVVEEQPPQSPSGLRTRRSELAAAGLVVDSGRRARLQSGRFAIVWAVVQ